MIGCFMFNRFLLMLILSFSNLGAKGLAEIADLPHAQKFITDVLKDRNLDPNDFEFKFSNEPIGIFCFDIEDKVFYFDLMHLKEINKTMFYPGSLNEECTCKNFGSGTRSQHLEFIKGVIGHEVHHAVEGFLSNLLKSIESLEDKIREIKRAEERADKHASVDPKVLMAFSRYFRQRYEELRKEFKSHEECEDFSQKIDPIHPTPFERAEFNSAFSCLLENRKEKKRQEARINQTLWDIEKII
ncbi:hypothetical protein EBU95_14150 [bacterium]|nr:hypothetical protein [bacterium]